MYSVHRIKSVIGVYTVEETVSVISSDPPCKDGNTRFPSMN